MNDCKHCNAQLFPDCECLTSSNNPSDSDLQFALPKARSNSGAKMIKHSGNGNGLLFHMTQPISRSIIKAIACSKPTISEN